MTDCGSIQERLSAYIDEALSSQEKAVVDEHLKTCRECAASLADMKKVIEHIKGLETVEPPLWMKQKIMAKVRAEARPKKGLFQKLFYPLHIKLPIEAVATVLVVGLALYIYRDIAPEMKLAQAPVEEVAPQVLGQQPALRDAEDKGVTPPVLPLDKRRSEEGLSLKEGKGEVAGKTEPTSERLAEKPTSAREPESMRDRLEATPKAPEPIKQAESTQGTEAPARAKKLERAATGAIAKDEARQEPKAAGSGAKLSYMEKKKEEPLILTVFVKDPESAVKEIEKALKEIEGKLILAESVEEKNIVTGEISSAKLKELLVRLKAVGRVKERKIDFESVKGEVKVKIEIVRISEEL